ncbi:MAG: 5-formyltetrahydrofolate cyclo-ligase [Cyclobacteriaceae bacterium]
MTKAALRQYYQSQRHALSGEEYAARNEQIFQHFREFFLPSQLHRQPFTIHCFLSSTQKREVDTTPFIRYFLSQPSVTLVAPYSHMSESRLTHHHLTKGTVLQTNRWGIPEPPLSTPTVAVEQVDWVLVPLLAIDLHGHRVGYGKGFYDRFLAQCRPDTRKIGLSLDEPTESIDNVNAHDVALNYGITPSRVWDFS